MNDNKAIVTGVMEALAVGDGRPFVDAMAEDFTWILEGTGPWSRRYEGKDIVRNALLKPLFAQFAGPYLNRADRIVAEDDTVVVLCRGNVETVSGDRYDNSYCYVFTLRDGQFIELREYLDTALVDRVLAPPAT